MKLSSVAYGRYRRVEIDACPTCDVDLPIDRNGLNRRVVPSRLRHHREHVTAKKTTDATMSRDNTRGMRVAVEGCGHGTLHAIYASVAKSCESKGWPDVDVLIIGGDFQVSSTRTAHHLDWLTLIVSPQCI